VKHRVSKSIVAALTLLSHAPLSAAPNDWQTQAVADRFTDERSLVSTRTYNGPSFKVQVQLVCTPNKTFSYRFTLMSDVGVEFQPDGMFAGTTTRVRIDDKGIVEIPALQEKRENTLPALAIGAQDVVRDYHDSVRYLAGELIENKNPADWQVLVNKYAIPYRMNGAIYMSMAESRVRVLLPTTGGDAVVDMDQTSPGPASVLKTCSLNRQKFVADVAQTKAKAVQALRQLALAREQQEAQDRVKSAEAAVYDESNWPANEAPSVEGMCHVVIDNIPHDGPCYIIGNSERLDLYAPPPGYVAAPAIPTVKLRITGNQAFGLVEDGGGGVMRTGILAPVAGCWRGGKFAICADPRHRWLRSPR
jgi:hypothetical protein